MTLRVVGVRGTSSGADASREEFLRIDLDEGEPIKLARGRLMRERDGVRVEVLRFQELIDENPWQLDPGESAVVLTAAGRDTYYSAKGRRPTFWLHVGADAPQWRPGDRVWVEDESGAALCDPHVVQP